MGRKKDFEKRQAIRLALQNQLLGTREICRTFHVRPQTVLDVKSELDAEHYHSQTTPTLEDGILDIVRTSTNPVVREYLATVELANPRHRNYLELGRSLDNFIGQKQEAVLAPIRAHYHALYDLALFIQQNTGYCDDRIPTPDVITIKEQEKRAKLQKLRRILA